MNEKLKTNYILVMINSENLPSNILFICFCLFCEMCMRVLDARGVGLLFCWLVGWLADVLLSEKSLKTEIIKKYKQNWKKWINFPKYYIYVHMRFQRHTYLNFLICTNMEFSTFFLKTDTRTHSHNISLFSKKKNWKFLSLVLLITVRSSRPYPSSSFIFTTTIRTFKLPVDLHKSPPSIFNLIMLFPFPQKRK